MCHIVQSARQSFYALHNKYPSQPCSAQDEDIKFMKLTCRYLRYHCVSLSFGLQFGIWNRPEI